ncbi:MAG TPA: hypothetical protein VD793_02585 [Gemmatimonadales bacterium]|nr:hypothetical protein [Gemmatimonadales bacterium]
MIRANVRERVTHEDRMLAVRLLARDQAGREPRHAGAQDNEAGDELLDDPRLFPLLATVPLGSVPSPAFYFYVAVRHHLLAVGVDDAAVTDYLGALLLEFGLRDRAHRITDVDDATYFYVTDVVADLEAMDGRRGFLLRAHLGNFSLWLAGVFPHHIQARWARKGGPDLEYYDALGARGFRLAAEHRLAREHGLEGVFERMADDFGPMRVALNRLAGGFRSSRGAWQTAGTWGH